MANELLPPLPQGTISLPSSFNLFMKGPILRKSSGSSSGKQEDSNGNVSEVSAREKLLNDQPELLQQFGVDLLPVLVQVRFLMHLYDCSAISYLTLNQYCTRICKLSSELILLTWHADLWI